MTQEQHAPRPRQGERGGGEGVCDDLRARIARVRAPLFARATAGPQPDRVPLLVGELPCGLADPRTLPILFALPGFARRGNAIALGAEGFEARSRALATAAARLRDAGLLRGWRNELLEVRPSPEAAPLAVIERVACRALGITTYAVHVNGVLPDGSLVICQRASDKSVDPGLWDNLAGGMIAAGESEREALEREAREEAGVRVEGLPITRGGTIAVSRPLGGEGYMSEIVQVYDLDLPQDIDPINQDGEVQAITRRSVRQVLEAVEIGDFTLEAALATLDGLERRAPALVTRPATPG